MSGFLSAIGLHTKGMTVEESQRMFIEEAYQSEGTAIQQAARGTYDPAYLNYTLGKLMIRQLREDWTRERGGRDGLEANSMTPSCRSAARRFRWCGRA